METLIYISNCSITAEQFVSVLNRSTLGERRPVDDLSSITEMLKHANLIVTAWDGDRLVGVSRSVTDFAFCCYLSDLAVDRDYQRRGIGLELIRLTQAALHPKATLILLAAPAAREYYPHIGMNSHDSAWIIPAGKPI